MDYEVPDPLHSVFFKWPRCSGATFWHRIRIPKAADSLVVVVTEKHSTRHERSESRRKHLWVDVSRWDPGMPPQSSARRQGLWNPSAGKLLETRAFKRCIYHRDRFRVFLPCTSPRAARSRSPSWQQPGNCTGFLSPVLAKKQTKQMKS